MFDFNFQWIDFNCSKCKYQIHTQIIDVKNECIVYCHNCKTSIKLKDESASSHKSIKNINKAFNELNKTLKNFGK